MDTLFYDSKCPLCQRNVQLLRRIAGPGLALVDLHSIGDEPGTPGKLLKLTTLHLLTGDGQWLTGVDATVRSWSHTRWGWLFSVQRWPLVGSIADHVYTLWAQRRYQRLYDCSGCGAEEA